MSKRKFNEKEYHKMSVNLDDVMKCDWLALNFNKYLL